MEQKTEVLRVPEVARELRIARSKAYEMCASGALRSFVIGDRSIRVLRKDLERYIEGREYTKVKQR